MTSRANLACVPVPAADGRASAFFRAGAYILLIAFLLLPALQGIHLGAHAGHAHAHAPEMAAAVDVVEDDHAEPSPAHPEHQHPDPADARCATCACFSQIAAGGLRLDLLAVLLGASPARFVAPDYLPPVVASVDRGVAIPRGPPAV